MIYCIKQPIQTTIQYQVEAPKGLSKEELRDFIRSADPTIQHFGFTDSEKCNSLSYLFMDHAHVSQLYAEDVDLYTR